jgi:hypothetical protein
MMLTTRHHRRIYDATNLFRPEADVVAERWPRAGMRVESLMSVKGERSQLPSARRRHSVKAPPVLKISL